MSPLTNQAVSSIAITRASNEQSLYSRFDLDLCVEEELGHGSCMTFELQSWKSSPLDFSELKAAPNSS
ncbi:hypothetical protein ACP70R_047863 [Stipagrostis hirtigluma subsp. patula]